ncbi:hypothetical protein DM02DRAFT_614158 [Periconia macrospinosa]|uniref:Uncharacterized protein n=1 Tax=Periconia macrospinosa TaxID=97972 RepID=A0A2V1DTW4_9PLEO|nr:hypothetical protein DM02DRAFT_614158 [Periconia macrospinosa]
MPPFNLASAVHFLAFQNSNSLTVVRNPESAALVPDQDESSDRNRNSASTFLPWSACRPVRRSDTSNSLTNTKD